MSTAAQPPGIPASRPDRPGSFFWRKMISLSITLIILPPLAGFVGAAMGMLESFTELSKTGLADPEVLANDISYSLLSTTYSLGISLVGVALLILSIIRWNARKRPTAQSGT